MLPEELRNYLDKCKGSNLTFADLLPRLQQSGWTADQIETARKYFSPADTIRPPDPVSVSLPPGTSAISSTDVSPDKPKKAHSFPIALVVFLMLFLVLTGGVGASAYLIAAGKIVIPDVNLQNKVSSFLVTIPFLPKNPKILLASSLAAHEKLSRNSFELSIAAASNDFQAALGSNSLDFQIKGYTDLATPENPRFYMTVDATKDFSAKIRKSDKMMYFKIDKVPLALSTFIGMDPNYLPPILENWVAYDTSGLETEAAINLPQLNPKSPIDEATQQMLIRLADEDIFPLITVTQEEVDGFSAYRLDFKPTPEQLDVIYYKLKDELSKRTDMSKNDVLSTDAPPSKSLRDFSFTIWIDSTQFYVRKAVLTSIFVSPSSFSFHLPSINYPVVPEDTSDESKSEVSFSMALKLSDFGQEQQITAPQASITPEEYVSLIMQFSSSGKFFTPPTQTPQ
jgi:hypothetical protein